MDNPQSGDLTKLSVDQLKILGFDEHQKLLIVQQNLQAIGIELNKRMNQPKEVKPKKK